MSLWVNIHTHGLKETQAVQILSVDCQSFDTSEAIYNPLTSFFSLAFHPLKWSVNEQLDEEDVNSKLSIPSVIAIGESGLDKHSALSTEEQMRLFRLQMGLSIQHQLPIIIHCVGRWNELEILFKEKKVNSPSWIIHGFRKTRLINKFLELGAYLSFGEALLYDELLQKAIKTLPLDRLFLETDDADVDILLLYEKLAQIKSVSLQVVIDQLFETYLAVFQHDKLA